MPERRVGATLGSLLVLGVETPTAAAIAAAPASVVRARPRGAPRTVRLPLLPLPAGSSPLAEMPSQRSLCPKQSVLETPCGWGGGGALGCRGRAGEGSLASELGGDARPRGRGDRQLV